MHHAEQLWSDYLALEGGGVVRHALLSALRAFVQAMQEIPPGERSAWIERLCVRVLDENELVPLRQPLVDGLFMPHLKQKLAKDEAPSARWLAALRHRRITDTPAWEELASLTEGALLERALQQDPDDVVSQRRLLNVRWRRLQFATHEVPRGILDGMNGADAEACTSLLSEIDIMESMAASLGEGDDRREVFALWRAQIEAYRDHLQFRPAPSYRELLEQRGLLRR